MPETIQEGDMKDFCKRRPSIRGREDKKGGYKSRPSYRGGMPDSIRKEKKGKAAIKSRLSNTRGTPETIQKGKMKGAMKVDWAPDGGCPRHYRTGMKVDWAPEMGDA